MVTVLPSRSVEGARGSRSVAERREVFPKRIREAGWAVYPRDSEERSGSE